MRNHVLVIPCYNEARRIELHRVEALLEDERIRVQFVDDGSRDETSAILAKFCAPRPERASLLSLPTNQGKAEAVRRGLLAAMAAGAKVVGYTDADFSTPPREISRLLDELQRTRALIVLGSRVARLGAQIDRSPVRHIVGRVFATFAGIAAGVQVYDTQCGAKWFVVTDELSRVLGTRFGSRWSFDVELLCRLFGRLPGYDRMDMSRIVEVPLLSWHDVRGSKLTIISMARAFLDVVEIAGRTLHHAHSGVAKGERAEEPAETR